MLTLPGGGCEAGVWKHGLLGKVKLMCKVGLAVEGGEVW